MSDAPHTKVYARGYFDGLAAAGITNTDNWKIGSKSVNESQFEIAYKSLTIQATKVYSAIPQNESWTPAQIAQELHRIGSSMREVRVIVGCINSMIDNGLVVETSKGHFKRGEIRYKQLASEIKTVFGKTPQQTPPQEVHPMSQVIPIPAIKAASAKAPATGPIERLSELAGRLRALAGDMDTAALELAEQAEKNEIETGKMRQLQTLLKSLA